MARIRYLKPEFFLNRRLADLGPHAMLLFQGLWLLADREGRLLDVPFSIHGQVFPYYKKVDCDAILRKLSAADFIDRYSDGDRNYIQVTNFAKHQKPHQKERPSVFPSPEQCKGLCSAPEKVVPSTGKEMIGMGNGNENENGNGEPAKAEKSAIERFDEFRSENQEWFEGLSETREYQDPEAPLLYGDSTYIKREIQKMRKWIEAEPQKGNKKNWKKFVLNWLDPDKQKPGSTPAYMTAEEEAAHYRSKERVGGSGGFTKISEVASD